MGIKFGSYFLFLQEQIKDIIINNVTSNPRLLPHGIEYVQKKSPRKQFGSKMFLSFQTVLLCTAEMAVTRAERPARLFGWLSWW